MKKLLLLTSLIFITNCTSRLETETKPTESLTPTSESTTIEQGSIYTQPKEPTENLGKNGDAWFDTSSLNWWSKKDGKWTVDANLVTVRSPSVESGTKIPALLSGSGVPLPSQGKDEDSYLDLSTGILYKKTVGIWLLSFNLKGSSGLNGTDGLSQGIDLANAPTTICPNGGVIISNFTDLNSNGIKDGNENSINSKNVCNGTTSSSSSSGNTGSTSGLSATTTVVSGQEFPTQTTGTSTDDVIYVKSYASNVFIDGKEGTNTIVVSDYFNYFTYIIGDSNTLYLRFQNYGTIKLVNIKYVQFGNGAYLFNGSTFTKVDYSPATKPVGQ